MISVSHLYYDYPDLRALHNINFELAPQSITALVGPNGAGKTTLLRSIAGLDEPFSGKIIINQVDVWKNPQQAKSQIGYLPDHFGLYSDLTSEQCLLYAAWSHGLRGEQAQNAVQDAIQKVELLPQLHRLAGTLSRGQRQRLALAQAIIHNPKVLLMDEPASGLDPKSRASIADLMTLLASQGVTILVSSHILAELDTYCTGMLIIEQGRMLAHRSIREEMLSTAIEQETSTSKQVKIRLLENQTHTLPELAQWLAQQGFQGRMTKQADHLLIDHGLPSDAACSALLQRLVQAQWPILEFAPQTMSLQDVYLSALSHADKNEPHITKEA